MCALCTGATLLIVPVIKIAIFATIVLWGCKFTNARICKETFYLNISELHIAMATSGKTHFWSVQCRFNVNLGLYSEQPRLAPYISLCLTLPVLSATSTSRPNLTHISYTFTRSFFSLISSWQLTESQLSSLTCSCYSEVNHCRIANHDLFHCFWK